MNRQALWYMLLLAIQFGIQPVLTRRYTSKDLPKSVVIFVQECCKFLMAWFMLQVSGCRSKALQDWSWKSWCHVAMIPAALYALQNVFALHAYQHLDALTFNVLNQTKTLSAALCCYLVLGSRQSTMQVLALLLLLGSALVMEQLVTWQGFLQVLTKPPNQWLEHASGSISDFSTGDDQESSSSSYAMWLNMLHQEHFLQGVLPILLASFISGLAGALSQKNLQSSSGGGRDPYLFSMELCAASAIILLAARLVSSFVTDGTTNDNEQESLGAMLHGLLGSGWTYATFIPILTNSAGGILVGLVTKYAGSVQKGFALIFGIFISGVVQQYMAVANTTDEEGKGGVATHQVMGGLLAAVSLWMHATHPPRPRKTEKIE
jgi:UDP-sugar transporter A1/2/3